jgi:uncharacterized protein YodC (DUF2158 family)
LFLINNYMEFKLGDVVIKRTGGNKMTITSIDVNENYECIWFDDKKLYNDLFHKNEIVTIPEYRKILKIIEREDKIAKILNGS